jgi:ribonucleoside-diphosphate reductase alpha chain
VRWLAARFCDTDVHEQMGIMTTEVRARKAAQEALMRGDTAGPAATDAADAPTGNGNGNGGNTRPGAGGHTTKPTSASAAAAARKPAADAITVDTPAAPAAKLRGLDLGPACSQCGGMMQRTGSCYTCSSCGNNTGCG